MPISWDWDGLEPSTRPIEKSEPLFTEGQKVFTKGGLEATIDKQYSKYSEFTYTISYEKNGRKYATNIKESSLSLLPFEPEPEKPKKDYEAIRKRVIEKAEEQKKRADLIGRLAEVKDPESQYFKQWGYIFFREDSVYSIEFISIIGVGVFTREQLMFPHNRRKKKTKEYFSSWKT
ncbi:hypothetical protein HP398_00625 [Brevibacillus sp. HB1.4B]|uniref:hypothetical protein n=1 Tax=Brevibacillus sp. HB1.4B TaxID=2738845 RepID=UPI00156B2CD0|nr:hypothetical protein [Brevibacillus sp. HB1.4B]NRS14936.1 hypothetical protein [Brevibacillus sp. HB1.4B]